jgi:hypothetical protein
MTIEIKDIIPVVLGVPVGIISYAITNYLLEPIREYRNIKSQILADLIYYDDVAEITNVPGPEQNKQIERNLKFHRYSADLIAAYHKLPEFHSVKTIWDAKEFPLKAAEALMHYSNAITREQIEEAKIAIKTNLILP